MAVYRWLERHAGVLARHVESPAKRGLVAEYLKDLHRRGKLTAAQRSRLTAALPGPDGR